jgi:outer membrane protein
MNYKILIITALCISGTYQAGAQAPEKNITLQAAIEVALANNIDLKQNELLVESSLINYNQAKNNRLPVASAAMNYGISSGRSIDPFTNSYINQRLSSSNGNLTASLPVFSGLRTKHTIQREQLSYQAAQLENQQEKDNLRLNVILAFLQLSNNEDVLQQTKQQSLLTLKQVERLEVLNKEGAIAPATFYDMKGQYAADQVAIVNAMNELDNSKLALARWMNIPYDSALHANRQGLDMTMEFYNMSAAAIYAIALQNLAMVKSAELRVSAASKNIKVANADRYPNISLFEQLGTNYSSAARSFQVNNVVNLPSGDYVVVNGNNLPVITERTNYRDQKIAYFNQVKNNINSYTGISLRIPLFNAFQAKTNVSLARVQEKNAGLVAESTRVELRQAIDRAYIGMTASWNSFKILAEQVTAFEQSFRAAEIRFNLGAINSVEYLIVKNNLDRANINLTVARYEYLLRTKVLDFYQGKR